MFDESSRKSQLFRLLNTSSFDDVSIDNVCTDERKEKTEYTYKDKGYRSLRDLFLKNNKLELSLDTLYKRYNSGWSLSSTLETPAGERNPDKFIEFEGRRFKSLADLHVKFNPSGISYRAFMKRIQKGWPIKKAIYTEASVEVTNVGIEFQGETYRSVCAIVRKVNPNNITYAAVKYRMNEKGWTLEQSILTPAGAKEPVC